MCNQKHIKTFSFFCSCFVLNFTAWQPRAMWELHGTQLPCVTAVWQGLVWPKAGCNVSLSCTGCQGLSFQETNQKNGKVFKKTFWKGIQLHWPLWFALLQVGVLEVDTILYIDCTKLGVLSQTNINALGELAERILFRAPSRYFDQTLVHLYLWSTFILDYFVDSKLEYIFPVLYKKWHRDISYLGGLFLRQETLKYKEVWWSWFHRCWLELMPLVPFVGTSGQDMVKHNTYISIHKHIIWFQGGVSTIQAQSGSWSIHKHYQTL